MSYNMTCRSADEENFLWPDDLVPDFKKVSINFMSECRQLALKILDAISLGLELKVFKLMITENIFFKVKLVWLEYKVKTKNSQLGFVNLNSNKKAGFYILLTFFVMSQQLSKQWIVLKNINKMSSITVKLFLQILKFIVVWHKIYFSMLCVIHQLHF